MPLHLLCFGLGGLGRALFPGSANWCLSLRRCAHARFPGERAPTLPGGARGSFLGALPGRRPASPSAAEARRSIVYLLQPSLGPGRREGHGTPGWAKSATENRRRPRPPPPPRVPRGSCRVARAVAPQTPLCQEGPRPSCAGRTGVLRSCSRQSGAGAKVVLGWGPWTRPEATPQGKGMTDEEVTFLRWQLF